MKFKKKKEVFIGNLRVAVDEETENLLRAHVPVNKRITPEGLIFTTYPDGHVEVETVYEYIQGMLKEMKK